MSEIEDFKQKAMQDASLRAELTALAGKSRPEITGAVIAIATRNGYTLTEGEISAAMDRQLRNAGPRDLSDNELESIAAAGECEPGWAYFESIA